MAEYGFRGFPFNKISGIGTSLGVLFEMPPGSSTIRISSIGTVAVRKFDADRVNDDACGIGEQYQFTVAAKPEIGMQACAHPVKPDNGKTVGGYRIIGDLPHLEVGGIFGKIITRKTLQLAGRIIDLNPFSVVIIRHIHDRRSIGSHDFVDQNVLG